MSCVLENDSKDYDAIALRKKKHHRSKKNPAHERNEGLWTCLANK